MAKWLDKYDAPQAQNGIEGTMGGLTDIGFNYNGAWGGAWRDGGWLEKYADDAQNGDEVTYTHNPSGSREAYMLKRTVTPYTSKRDIRKKTQTPTDPRQVNFLSNYAGAIGEPGSEGFVYPTSVPFEGKKHWNIDRFIIDPQFGTSYPDLNNQASTRQQMRNNVLADMYKYNMLQNPDKRGKAWRQAKKFVRTEIDPRTSGAYYEEAVRSKLPFAAGSITDAVDESYMRGFGVAQSSAQSPDVSDDDYYTRDFKNKPITESRAKEVATDWLRNYKGLSKKQAKQYIQSLPTYKKLRAFESGGILQPPMAGANQTVPMAQNGLTYLEPNSYKLPRVGPSSELAMSIGGEGGEPAYLIPTMKYGRMQVDPLFEFKRTGEHLGGPFKTWQEAEAWERDVRHPYVEKGQSIPTPYRRWGQFEEGGSIPSAQTGTRQSVTANPQDYRRWQDSVANYQQGLRELAEARQRTSTNINNYSLLNPTNLVSTFGNLLFGDEKGSRRVKPTYREVSVPRSAGWYRPNDPEQQPMNYVAIGDPFFDTGYELSNLGVKSEYDDDREVIDAKTSMYSPYGSFVALYHPPVRQNLVLQELKGRSSKPQPKPKPPRKLEKPKLDSLDIPDIKLTDVRPSIAQPKFEQTKVDEQKPTKYSYTYPTFDKDVQKTMYFPDRNSWKTFVEQQRGASSQEGKDYGSATGQFAMGGSLPGSVGFTYARVSGAAPSEGPYAKKTLPSAQNGIEQSNLEGAADWYKSWYQQRQALPQFQALAQRRLEGMAGGLPQVVLKPIEELKKIGAIAEFEKAKSIYPQMDKIYASDPATVEAYQQTLEQERGKPLEYSIDPEVGISKPVLTHEMSHWFDARFPQSMFSKEGSEKYPTSYNFEFGKKSPLSKEEQEWIAGRMMAGATPLKTEVNAVLNNLRQAEGLRGDQPTTPEQMQKIIEKYRNLPKDKLASQTKEGSINSIIRTLIESVGGDPEKLSELNNRIVAAPQQGTPMAQNGAEMKFYQQGLDWTPRNISRNGGWLDKYDAPQAQTGKMLEYLKSKKTAPVVTKGEPMSEEMQKRITTETLRRQTQKNKPLTQLGAKQIKQQQYDLKQKAEDQAWARDKRIKEEEEEARIAEGRAAEATRENPNVPFTFPTGESKLWKDMDWREQQYVSGRNLGSMSRFNNWTDWINPITMFGEMGEGLATAPYMARETDSNLPYAVGIGSPLLTGALGGAGTKGTKKTSSLFGKSKPKVGPDEELSIVPSGVKSDRHISQDDVQSIFKKEADWLRSDEYLKRRIAATGENPITVKKDVEKAISRFDDIEVNVKKQSKNTLFGTYNPSSNVIELSPTLDKAHAIGTLDHEIKHALSQLSTTGYSAYKKYPTTTLGNVLTRNFSAPMHMEYLNKPWEQQVRKLRLLDFINETQGVPRGQKLTMKNIEQFAEDVKPAIGDEPAGFFAKDFSRRYGDVQQGYISGIIEANEKLKFVPQNLLKLKFPVKLQRQSNEAIRQTLLDQLNKAYAVPGAAAVGAASMLGGESEESPKRAFQYGGDIPVDPMGYWNPENVGNPVTIPSNIITMEGVDQPLLGISDTGDVQYMEPGEDYEFDGEYVTEYPMAKGGVSVNNADAQPIEKLDQLLNFTNYNKPTKGGWLDKYN